MNDGPAAARARIAELQSQVSRLANGDAIKSLRLQCDAHQRDQRRLEAALSRLSGAKKQIEGLVAKWRVDAETDDAVYNDISFGLVSAADELERTLNALETTTAADPRAVSGQ